MVKVTYSDCHSEEYPSVAEAEKAILAVFAGSEGAVLPEQVEELDDAGGHLRDLGCDWQVHLVSLDD